MRFTITACRCSDLQWIARIFLSGRTGTRTPDLVGVIRLSTSSQAHRTSTLAGFRHVPLGGSLAVDVARNCVGLQYRAPRGLDETKIKTIPVSDREYAVNAINAERGDRKSVV